MASKRASKTAKTTPKRLKVAEDGSRGPEDGLKTAQEAPKMASMRPKSPQGGPRELQEALQESTRGPKTLIFLWFFEGF
jgi:hypothetical protein